MSFGYEIKAFKYIIDQTNKQTKKKPQHNSVLRGGTNLKYS